MFDAADLAAFIDPSMPGYALATINGTPVGGLFRSRYAESFSSVAGSSSQILVLDTVVATENDAVLIDAIAYTIYTIEPADPGFKILRLEKE